jgi:hypothetical protein
MPLNLLVGLQCPPNLSFGLQCSLSALKITKIHFFSFFQNYVFLFFQNFSLLFFLNFFHFFFYCIYKKKNCFCFFQNFFILCRIYAEYFSLFLWQKEDTTTPMVDKKTTQKLKHLEDIANRVGGRGE